VTAISSSWLVGSIDLAADATIVVDGASDAVISAGTYYLKDATASRSLLDAIETAAGAHMTNASVFIGRDRKIRVTADALFTWAIPEALRDALGFGAAIASTTSATASSYSTLLWSPGWPETTTGHPVGVEGRPVPQWVQTSSPSGLTVHTTIQGTTAKLTELSWRFVKAARAWTSGELPGEFYRFFADVLYTGHRWKLYSGVTEDDASAVEVTLPAALGPYKVREPNWTWYQRAINDTDTHVNIEGLKATLTGEIA